jgi:hypothetical protein
MLLEPCAHGSIQPPASVARAASRYVLSTPLQERPSGTMPSSRLSARAVTGVLRFVRLIALPCALQNCLGMKLLELRRGSDILYGSNGASPLRHKIRANRIHKQHQVLRRF